MARPLRIEFPGAFFHLTERGDRRDAIYEDDVDRVDSDRYLQQLSRYLALNPVCAGLVGDRLAWPWSSYRATAGLPLAPAWLTTETPCPTSGGSGTRPRRAIGGRVSDAFFEPLTAEELDAWEGK